jgi:hypothetical protein
MAKQEYVQPSKDIDTILLKITALGRIQFNKLNTIVIFISYWKVYKILWLQKSK